MRLATVEVEPISRFADVSAFERHPAKRLLSPITEIGKLLLGPAFHVLLAYRVDGSGVQLKFFAAAGGELVQVETRKPAPIKSKCVLLPVVGVVPHERHRPRLFVQQASQRFHAVAVHQDHLTTISKTGPERTPQ